jgi:hypothetical protein
VSYSLGLALEADSNVNRAALADALDTVIARIQLIEAREHCLLSHPPADGRRPKTEQMEQDPLSCVLRM